VAAPGDEKSLQALQYIFVSPIGAYWWSREAGHEQVRAECEARGDTFMLVLDEVNRAGAKLRKDVKRVK